MNLQTVVNLVYINQDRGTGAGRDFGIGQQPVSIDTGLLRLRMS